ncbi:MAG: OmpH family outer membrane protein [Rickettsiaceae bacterium]|nr:OmpH family outer membrane protein [Rickettsiaceae bacterium]
MNFYTKAVFLFLSFVSHSCFGVSADSEVVKEQKHCRNIIVVSIDKVFSKALVVKDIESQIGDMRRKTQYAMIDKEKDFKKLEQDLIAKKGKIDAALFQKEVLALNEMAIRLQQEKQQRKASLDKSLRNAKELVNAKIDNIIKELAEEKNIDFVMPANHSLYYSPDLDMTDEVLNRLNTMLQNLPLE